MKMKNCGKVCGAAALIFAVALTCVSCSHSGEKGGECDSIAFPYQAFIDSMRPTDDFPVIGEDGNGFRPLSDRIKYASLSSSKHGNGGFADSLLLIYNAALAFNAITYDLGSAERFADNASSYLAALDSIDVSGVTDGRMADALRRAVHSYSTGESAPEPAEGAENPAIKEFFTLYDKYCAPLLAVRKESEAFNPAAVVEDYAEVHEKAMSDTALFRNELLSRVIREKDFGKKSVLARELAFADYHHPHPKPADVVAVIDGLLRQDRYTPLLSHLWRIWRSHLQIYLLGGGSNDSPIYNGFYNEMRNRVALTYINHLAKNPADDVAFQGFIELVTAGNVVRNSRCLFGNNANLDAMELLYFPLHPEEDSGE